MAATVTIYRPDSQSSDLAPLAIIFEERPSNHLAPVHDNSRGLVQREINLEFLVRAKVFDEQTVNQPGHGGC